MYRTEVMMVPRLE